MRYLAHRGFWKTNQEKNSRKAFVRAIQLGFGIETDVRDFMGNLVISHDPPVGNEILFEEFLEIIQDTDAAIALNIKSDGLLPKLIELIDLTSKPNIFTFDMSGPEYVKYSRSRMNVFERISEYESGLDLPQKPLGYWLDSFTEDGWRLDWLDRNEFPLADVCIVSPELHARPHLPFWADLKKRSSTANLMLCTDFPDEARDFFGDYDN